MTRKSDQTQRAGGRAKSQSAQLLGSNSEIGRKLKQYYDELVSDDVPDRFANLLSKLEQAEPAGMPAASDPKAED
jgi:Anti-sigma factor NepR